MTWHGPDRKVIEDAPLGYGQADCIDCGTHGERRLPDRYPHICHTCLFPPPRVEDPDADPPDFMPVVGLIEALQQRNLVVGVMQPGERRLDG